MVLAVPHKEHTFDLYREVTTLAHHVEDYENYERERDLQHVVDYYENAAGKYAGETWDIAERCQKYKDGDMSGLDIHYHTFTEDSMREILEWFEKNVYKWKSCKVFEIEAGSNEFYVQCVK
jgi:hypothetical protein